MTNTYLKKVIFVVRKLLLRIETKKKYGIKTRRYKGTCSGMKLFNVSTYAGKYKSYSKLTCHTTKFNDNVFLIGSIEHCKLCVILTAHIKHCFILYAIMTVAKRYRLTL